VPRHVIHVESHGFPTPLRLRRQRQALDALCENYPALLEARRPRGLSPRASFGFSTRTSAGEAVANLAARLDTVSPGWRSYLMVWDGFPGGMATAAREPQFKPHPWADVGILALDIYICAEIAANGHPLAAAVFGVAAAMMAWILRRELRRRAQSRRDRSA